MNVRLGVVLLVSILLLIACSGPQDNQAEKTDTMSYEEMLGDKLVSIDKLDRILQQEYKDLQGKTLYFQRPTCPYCNQVTPLIYDVDGLIAIDTDEYPEAIDAIIAIVGDQGQRVVPTIIHFGKNEILFHQGTLSREDFLHMIQEASL